MSVMDIYNIIFPSFFLFIVLLLIYLYLKGDPMIRHKMRHKK